ncbi:PTS sugar transporter subunit IIA [Parasphingorhabdus sp.]|jgi:PTS system nitrogen regulatory IIA component|uniref:PTS sugar transporter subunit IIA n=1 Tax=Parasphingorhabdus sp. TaxID=2709688 RepID=UPI003D2E826C
MSSLSVRLELAAIAECSDALSKGQILARAAEIAGDSYQLDSEHVQGRLTDREKLGSTGFGRGIAIPHAKLDKLAECVGIFFRLARPVDFDSHDGKPVDLIFVLLSPQMAGVIHLKALAEISRYLRDENMVAKLRGASGRDALFTLLTDQRQSKAA